MMLSAIGLPADRSGVYGKCQDWLQAHGISVYEPQRRHGDGTFPGEWTGDGFAWRPATVTMMRQLSAPMVWHVSSYYYQTRPAILSNALPALPAMRQAVHDLGVQRPWFMVDEPPHFALDANGNQRYGWTQEIEDEIAEFVKISRNAGFDVGVTVPGLSQLAFWRARLQPSWWIVNDQAKTAWPSMPGCWLYNAATYTGLAERLRAVGASGYLQWSGVRTTKTGPVPILFDGAGNPTDAAWHLVSELQKAQTPLTVEERLADLERRVTALEERAT